MTLHSLPVIKIQCAIFTLKSSVTYGDARHMGKRDKGPNPRKLVRRFS
jgi:hypothetical protein